MIFATWASLHSSWLAFLKLESELRAGVDKSVDTGQKLVSPSGTHSCQLPYSIGGPTLTGRDLQAAGGGCLWQSP